MNFISPKKSVNSAFLKLPVPFEKMEAVYENDESKMSRLQLVTPFGIPVNEWNVL